MERKINRGDLYYAELGESNAVGSEQTGIRPVVVIQNNIGNEHSPTVIIAPVTSKTIEKAKLPTHIFLKGYAKRLVKNSLVLLEQMRVIDKTRLTEKIDYLRYDIMQEIDKKLMLALGIKNM